MRCAAIGEYIVDLMFGGFLPIERHPCSRWATRSRNSKYILPLVGRSVATRGQKCRLLAQSGHFATESQCPLLAVKRTSVEVGECALMTQSGHGPTTRWAVSRLPPRSALYRPKMFRLHRTAAQIGCRRSYRSLAQNSPLLVRNPTSLGKLS